ncbi:hypothetical protein F8388_000558 [Cannabis sativa]|uniref:Longin domain-containing protein n=1 Tax=Cannabis sativa TaxID=3483 RepID=A0A7J6F051_CANSA|nr:hypothetical protein F8388_000558 [Cannabis sativa]
MASVTYCVVAAESASRQIPIAFLERVNEDFNKRYGGGKAATIVQAERAYAIHDSKHSSYMTSDFANIKKLKWCTTGWSSQSKITDVEDDCTEAFNMDNRYIKAFSRDGTLMDENVAEPLGDSSSGWVCECVRDV